MEKDYSFLKVFLDEPLFIIQENIPETALNEPIPTKVNFIGENKKNILVLVEYDKKPSFSKSEEFELLLKILHAVKLSQHEVAILPYSSVAELELSEIRKQTRPRTIVSLAQNHLIPDSIPANTPTDVEGTKYLSSTALSVLSENVAEKKALWAALQTLF